jgi:predicted glutamine amidotransferase
MCGIFGFIAKKQLKADENKLKVLSLYNVSRGYDATGVLMLKNEVFDVKKGIINSFKFGVENPNIYKDKNILIGHTRAKTVGPNTIINAHPFTGDVISGVHNGTLKNHEYMYEYYSNKNNKLIRRNLLEKEISDSNLLYRMFNTEGYNKVLETYEGALAMLSMTRDGTMHAYHDEGRPLHVGESEEGLYFSSNQHPLVAIGCTNIKHLNKYAHYQYKDGVMINYKEIVRNPLVKPVVVIPDAEKKNFIPSTILKDQKKTLSGESMVVVSKQEAKEIKEMNDTESYIEVSILNKILYMPYEILLDTNRWILTFEENHKLIQSKSGSFFTNLISSNYKEITLDDSYCFSDDNNDTYLFICFKNKKDEFLLNHVTVKIPKDFCNSFLKETGFILSETANKLLINSIGGKEITIDMFFAKVFIDFLDIIETNKRNNSHQITIPYQKQLNPFIAQNVDKKTKIIKINSIKFPNNKGILMMDDKFLHVNVGNPIGSNKVSLKLINPAYEDVKIIAPLECLLTNQEYLNELSEKMSIFMDDVDERFDHNSSERNTTLMERHFSLEGIFAGVSYLEFFEKLETEMHEISNLFVNKEIGDKIISISKLIENQKGRHLNALNASIKKLKNVIKENDNS